MRVLCVCQSFFMCLCFVKCQLSDDDGHYSTTTAFFFSYHIIFCLCSDLCMPLSFFNMFFCLFPLSLSICVSDICFISWRSYCVWAWLLAYKKKVKYVPEEVKAAIVAKCFNQLMDRTACLSWWNCVKHTHTEDQVMSKTYFIWPVFA